MKRYFKEKKAVCLCCFLFFSFLDLGCFYCFVVVVLLSVADVLFVKTFACGLIFGCEVLEKRNETHFGG